MKGWLKWRIVRKADFEYLTKENEGLRTELAIREKRNAELRERIDKIEKGKRCYTKYCASCEYACKVNVTEFHDAFGYGQRIDAVCVLDAPCPDFERKE